MKYETLYLNSDFISAVLHTLPTPVLVIDPCDQKIVAVNKAAIRYSGYTREEFLLKQPQSFSEVLSPMVYDRVLYARDETEFVELPSVFYDNRNMAHEVLFSFSSFKYEDRDYLTVTMKNKEPVSSETERSTALNPIGKLILEAQVGIWQLNQQGIILFVNDYLASLLGYTKEEMIGKSALEFAPSENGFDAAAILKERAKGIAKQYEQAVYTTRHEKKYLLVQPTIIKENGVFKGSLATIIDITDKKEIEEKFQANEKVFKALVEHSTDVITMLSADARVLYVSPSVEKLGEFSAEEFIGKRISEEYFHPADFPLFQQAYTDVLNDPYKIATAIYRHRISKDGAYVWMEAYFSNLLHEPGINAIVINLRDITKTKLVEEELTKVQERYQIAEKQGNLGHWQWVLRNDELIWSDHLYTMFQMERGGKIDLQTFIQLVHPEEREAAKKLIENSIEQGRNYQFTHRIATDAGEIKFIREVAELIHDEKGNLIKVAGISQDVTERVLAAEALRQSEEKYRFLFDKNPVPMFIVEYPRPVIIHVNDAATRDYGYSKEELLGADPAMFSLRSEDYLLDTISESLGRDHPFTKVVQHRKKNGDLMYMRMTAIRTVFDKRQVWLIGCINVSFEITYERQLKKNEEQLALIFNGSTNAMWLLNVEPGNRLRYAAVNDAYSSHTGLQKTDMIGKFTDEMNFSDLYTSMTVRYAEAIETRRTLRFLVELDLSSERKIAEIIVTPVEDETGRINQLLCTAIDITEKKKFENQLLQKNRELKELMSHLQGLREEERTNIAREIHDELGQHLTAIKINVAWVHKACQLQDSVSSRLKDSLGLIDNTIATVRKIASALRPSILDDLGLQDAIESYGADFSKRTAIEFYFDDETDRAPIEREVATAMYRICQESLTNVARHANATIVTCKLYMEGSNLVLDLQDDGVGFNMIEKGLEAKSFGLLGMRERVAMRNGIFDLRSRKGSGTRTIVKLPLA